MWTYLKKRFSERSTWTGIGAALAASLGSVSAYLGEDYLHGFAVATVIIGVIAAAIPTGGTGDAS